MKHAWARIDLKNSQIMGSIQGYNLGLVCLNAVTYSRNFQGLQVRLANDAGLWPLVVSSVWL